uniref:Large ribosomal subunit protein uL2m n=1 Tax=Malawimonas jakobiformis TaxID=136089 RepID=Q9G871_MALJA|nr:ribosomal protein L2 [Malawimonas jakobiformis]AAG13702.1 ribosomal protein L2 [Malawimonas jakobiformis]
MKLFNPITPSNRHRTIIFKNILWTKKPINKLTIGLNKKSGHNNKGRITIYNRGGGHKQRYRKIDFKRSLINIPAMVIRIEYDPNRTANIALICYRNGILSYILAPNGLKVGSIIKSNIKAINTLGNSSILKNILIGTVIHNIELVPGKGGQLARAAGTYALLVSKTANGYAMLRLKSGETRLVSIFCMATIGVVSNIEHNNTIYGKAGASRWSNRKPVVRGIVMNPVDHPHGGRTKGGRPSVTPWGRPTKGMRTVTKKNKLILKKRYQ